ncbi:MAG: ABC transporter ATP-binding protein [Acidobacteria bacterium]|nr:MAG: ABC transporter ATP-binding protein [Acidobacteriota bacterium]MCL4286413.1 ABC transporter ATP-binding protein [Thermoleophilia bacterium]GIK78782.1 MAG: spermidine/putrescine import ATP-binding protein PotA 2 [Actinomycetes bacterium]
MSLRGVTKRFGEFTAVDSIDLDIREGEFFTLLGPSGCGKTTTLRMIAGFEEPNAGEILVGGEDVAGLPAHKRPTNTVFQSYALFPHLTVRDNVAYGLKRKRVDKAEIDERVKAELERVGLANEANRKPNQLSGGQQQRVALARAVVNLPKVLLLDEPLGALDLKLRKGLQLELKRIQQEIGITFVYVTHDQEEALTMSDRIAVMNRGVVEQVDNPVEIYERPTTTFVAGFIGVSNLMPGVVRSLSGEKAEVELEAGVTISADANGLGTGERCHAVVRPEKLYVAPKGMPAPELAADAQSVDGVVTSSVFLGTATQLVVELRGGARMTVLYLNTDEAKRQELPGGGADVTLSWTPEHIHLVRESGTERATADHEALARERADAA